MIFRKYDAPADLAHYIRCFWTLENNEPSALPFIHRATAECCAEFIFYYKGSVNMYKSEAHSERTFSAGLYAQSQAYRKFAIDKPFGMLGVYLYPQTLPLLFNIPADTLSDHNLDVTSLFGNEGTILQDQVMCSTSHNMRIELIANFLRVRLTNQSKKTLHLSNIIRQAIATGTMPSVNDIANPCNLSVRQIERDFKSLVGFSPRLFSKLTRFRSLMESVTPKSHSLTDLAYEFNYYDQSHFINEFRRFTGISPTQYMKDRMQVDNERMTPETSNNSQKKASV